MKNKYLSNKISGFTLIELLVVISIIALLASVVLVALNSSRQKARDVRRIADMNQMAKAMELYFNQNFSYPVNASWTELDKVLNMTPTYLTRLPIAPTPSDNPPGTSICTGGTNCTGRNYGYYCYQGSVNFYTISFCIGNTVAATGGNPVPGGIRYLTPNGFK